MQRTFSPSRIQAFVTCQEYEHMRFGGPFIHVLCTQIALQRPSGWQLQAIKTASQWREA